MALLKALLMAALAACVAGGAAAADDGHDHDRARRAVEEGRILPLRDILARAQADNVGQVLEVELEDERGVPVYEIKILSADGRVLKRHYDARTGALLKSRDGDRRR
ncbi:PepSY domain-containing protein [Reyranella sp.]|uniref:PepSY domain-containing protein n=1 Tax=Reyranella sp. TaxID=1929291 RepID=UPI003BAC386B